MASAFAISQLRLLGHSWPDIQVSIVQRMSRGVPGFFVLFAIGLLIGSWMVSGTIPMLVHWGFGVMAPQWFYPLAFLVPVVFSTLTGTSRGSAGTVGVVIMVIAPILAITDIGCAYGLRRDPVAAAASASPTTPPPNPSS